MFRDRCVLGVAASVCALALVSSSTAHSQGQQKRLDGVFDQSEILVISTDLPGNPGAVVTKAGICRIGSREFLHGTGADVGGLWHDTKGAGVYIPVNHITQVVAYKNAADAKKALSPTPAEPFALPPPIPIGLETPATQLCPTATAPRVQ